MRMEATAPNPDAEDGVDGCLRGGTVVSSGLDDGQDAEGEPAGAANDGQLAPGEVDAVTFVCHGVDGPQGGDGPQGDPGERGDQGDAGADGLVSLVRIEVLVANPEANNGIDGCVAGGFEVLAGIDDGLDAAGEPAGEASDGLLDDLEVDARALLCHALPGEDGADGEDGRGCQVQDNGDGTVTITCGGDEPVTFAVPLCGNGLVEAGEPCDDGNDSNADACLTDCTPAACGDGHVWEDEEDCDDANEVDTDACLTDCSEAACGDGHIWEGEEGCDDANDVDDDSCTNLCEAVPQLPCEAGEQVEREGRIYTFCPIPAAWPDALAACATTDDHLVKIETEAENTWLVDQCAAQPLVAEEGTPLHRWIGLNDVASAGDWVWHDGTTPDDFFPQVAPPDWSSNRDYASLLIGEIADNCCDAGDWHPPGPGSTRAYICESD
jgi:cysteine-rich repeat protein